MPSKDQDQIELTLPVDNRTEELTEENNSINPALLATLNEIERITYPLAMQEMAQFGGQFLLSRLSISVYIMANGIVMAQLGNNAAAAGAIITTFNTLIRSFPFGSQMALPLIVGGHVGEKQPQLIGEVARFNLIWGTSLGIGMSVLYWYAGDIAYGLGVSSAVKEEIDAYFHPYILTIVPSVMLNTAQYVALGLKQSRLVLVSEVSFVGMAMLVSYPLALLTELEIAGLSYGMLVSGLLNGLGLWIYYGLRSDYRQYNLFNFNLKGFNRNLRQYLKIGVPLGLFRFTEWFNLAAISVLAARLGTTSLLATEAAIQPVMAFNVFSMGLAQAGGIKITREFPAVKLAKELKHPKLPVLLQRLRRFGLVSTGLGLTLTTVGAGAFMIFAEDIAAFFIDTDSSEGQDALTLAQTLLIINAVGMFPDMIRTAATGALNGIKNTYLPPLVSFLFLSVMSLTAGGIFSLVLDWGADWLFITRDIGIVFAATVLAIRWFTQTNLPNNYLETQTLLSIPSINNQANRFSFFNNPSLEEGEEAVISIQNDHQEKSEFQHS